MRRGPPGGGRGRARATEKAKRTSVTKPMIRTAQGKPTDGWSRWKMTGKIIPPVARTRDKSAEPLSDDLNRYMVVRQLQVAQKIRHTYRSSQGQNAHCQRTLLIKIPRDHGQTRYPQAALPDPAANTLCEHNLVVRCGQACHHRPEGYEEASYHQ
jgi:hypothetical protein